MEFEWDDAKARINLRVYGVTFESAGTAYRDADAIEFEDDRDDYGENRMSLIGLARNGEVLFVVITKRSERVRIISARRATRREQEHYFRQTG